MPKQIPWEERKLRGNPFLKKEGKEPVPVVHDPRTGKLVGYRGSVPSIKKQLKVRPRLPKLPEEMAQELLAKEEKETAKKRRGRPPKVVSETPEMKEAPKPKKKLGRPKGSKRKAPVRSKKRKLLDEMIRKKKARLKEEKSRPKSKGHYPCQVVVQLSHATRSLLLAEVEKRSMALGVRVYIADVARDYLEKGMQEDHPGHKVEGEVRSYQKPQPPPDPYARFSVRQTQRLKVLGITPPPSKED